jgi:hypothetical protein
MWGALSDERMGLSFVYATGPCQCSLSQVRVPWYSRPYFTVSNLRLPFSSPLTTRRVTVEIFDPASTRVSLSRDSLYSASYIASGQTNRKHRFHCYQNNFPIVTDARLPRRCIETVVFYCFLRIHRRGNVFTKPLPSSGRLLWFHYSDFQASFYNTVILVNLFGICCVDGHLIVPHVKLLPQLWQSRHVCRRDIRSSWYSDRDGPKRP